MYSLLLLKVVLQPFHTSSDLVSVSYLAFAAVVCARVLVSASFGILTCLETWNGIISD